MGKVQIYVTVHHDKKISFQGEGDKVVLLMEEDTNSKIYFSCPTGSLKFKYKNGEVLHKSRIPFENEFMYQASIRGSAPLELFFEGNLEGWVNDTYLMGGPLRKHPVF